MGLAGAQPILQTDLPDGQFANFRVQPLCKKFFAWPFGRHSIRAKSSRPTKGRFAIVTDVRWDAMDASAL
jgi:hypothetical protein